MLNLKEVSSNNKGFTLIELLIGISLFCILLSSMYSLMYFTTNLAEKGDDIDIALSNGRYAIEYIKNEIISADRIISSSKFDNLDELFPTNIGFVSMEKQFNYDSEGKITKVNYNYRTYYQKNDELVRIAYNTSNKSEIKGSLFSGYNQICNGLVDFSNSKLDIESSLINLYMKLKQGEEFLILETSINLRCPSE